MNKQRLDEIRATAEAATPGKHGWKVTNVSYLELYRQDIPDLLAYVEELEKRLAKAREIMDPQDNDAWKWMNNYDNNA